jgi:hypothetical protein
MTTRISHLCWAAMIVAALPAATIAVSADPEFIGGATRPIAKKSAGPVVALNPQPLPPVRIPAIKPSKPLSSGTNTSGTSQHSKPGTPVPLVRGKHYKG